LSGWVCYRIIIAGDVGSVLVRFGRELVQAFQDLRQLRTEDVGAGAGIVEQLVAGADSLFVPHKERCAKTQSPGGDDVALNAATD
jgi:hypothetical protein